MRTHFVPSILAVITVVNIPFSSSSNTAPKYAPIPAEALSPPISNTTSYRVEHFGSSAYMVTDGIYQALFFVACESVIVVDAPPTIGHKLLTAIRTVSNLPVSHFVYSHSHADHVGAAYLLDGDNITFVANEETEKALAQTNDPNRPLPNITFSEDLNLTVCNQTLNLSYKGPNHEPGNIFIYAPVPKVLMLVDVVFPGWAPFDRLAESQNIPGWIQAHDLILEYRFDYYVGGHLNRVGTRQDVINQRDYITQLFDTCAEGIRLSAAPPNASNPLSVQETLSAVQEANPGNSWALFQVYLQNVVGSWCANKTTETWLGRLAGVDVFSLSNAVTMVTSLRIDYGVLGPFGVIN
ncbi:MAG: hypothetical protein Q9219_001606 [cf. Caloplaca sp. 3 TL-2023]